MIFKFTKFLFCHLLVSLILVVSFQTSIYAADSFTISGTLMKNDPSNNKYQANYKLLTPQGSYYYLDLKKDFYESWVGKTTYFNVKGSVINFDVYSSGKGKKTNTMPKKLPTTGGGIAGFAFFAAFLGMQIRKRK